MRILIVEDDPTLAEGLRSNLTDAGMVVLGVAADALTAFDLAEAQPPDAAIVDIALDGALDGLSVGEYLAERGVRVIYLSGYLERALVRPDRGATVALLSKACRFEELLSVLRNTEETLPGTQ